MVNDILDVMKQNNVEVDMLDVNDHKTKRSDMTANPILLQKKYSRVIEYFAKQQGISLDVSLDFFYHSETYQLMREGISDMHGMNDEYLVEELQEEYVIKY